MSGDTARPTALLAAILSMTAAPAWSLGSCDTPDGALATPLFEVCQEQAMRFDPAVPSTHFYEVDLRAGHRYVFSPCWTTCSRATPDDLSLGLTLYDSECRRIQTGFTDFRGCSATNTNSFLVARPECDGRHVVEVTTIGGLFEVNDVRLGYKETCLPPLGVFLEERTVTPMPECGSLLSLSFSTDGPGPYTWDWRFLPGFSITDPDPPSGTATTVEPRLTIEATVFEAENRWLVVEVSNACGTEVVEMNADTHDAIPPELALSVVECTPETIVMADEREAPTVRPPPPPATSPPAFCEPTHCAAPCTSGTLTLDANPWYEAIVDCSTGALTLRTGAAHPLTVAAGRPVGLLAGADTGAPVGADLRFLHDSFTSPWAPTGGVACFVDPPDTPEEPDSVGIEITWRWQPTLPVIDVWLRQQVVVFGTETGNAGVRLSSMAAPARTEWAEARRMLAAWMLDPDLAGDPGPLLSWQDCWQPDRIAFTTSAGFTAADVAPHDVLRFDPNDGPGGVALQVARSGMGWIGVGRLAGVTRYDTPDRLRDCRFFCLTSLPTGTPGVDADSGLVTWMEINHEGMWANSDRGYFRRDGLVLRAVSPDEGCGFFDIGGDASLVTCAPACVTLDAATTDACGPVRVGTLGVSPAAAPPCPSLPCTLDLALPGTYRYGWQAADDTGNVRNAGATIRVVEDAECNRPPECAMGGAAPQSCRSVLMGDVVVSDAEGDPVSWRWEADDPRVTFTPEAGLVVATPAGTPLPPTVARWDGPGAPCGISAVARLVVDDGRHPRRQSCELPIEFRDAQPPRLMGAPADETVECDRVPPAPVVRAEDDCDPAPRLESGERIDAGDCPGRYTITRDWRATDSCGNLSSHRQVVSVVDTRAPLVLSDSRVAQALWPPNHRMTCFEKADFAPTVLESCSEPTTWRFVGCASDQADEVDGARTQGDGNAPGDCQVAADGASFCVRAERAGGGPDGRRYAVTIVAEDACGNAGPPSVIGVVHVPHDRR